MENKTEYKIEITPDEHFPAVGIRLRYPDGSGQIITPDTLEREPEKIARFINNWHKEQLNGKV